MPALFAHRTTAPCAGAAERQQLQRRASRALRRSSRPPVAAELAAEAERAGDTEGAVVDAQFWTWRGHRVSYERVSPRRASSAGAAAEASPICVVHGFGSNAKHFRRLTTALAARSGREVFALDQLGFGASDKPALEYTPRLWACQVTDFLSEVVGRPAVLLGNSIGSQVAIIAASDAPERVSGLCLLNVAAGMNQKGLYDDSPLLAAMAPLFSLVEFLLKQPAIARYLFNSFRSKANVEKILREQVYRNPKQVDAELVETLYAPSSDDGALGVFVQVFTGDPGPRPEVLARSLRTPMKLIWGEVDAWTPANGTVARAFRDLAAARPQQVQFATVPNCGHVPYDDCPEQVLELALPWLAALPRAADA